MLAAPAPVRPGEHAGHVVLEELQVRPVAPRQAPHRAAPQLSDVLLQGAGHSVTTMAQPLQQSPAALQWSPRPWWGSWSSGRPPPGPAR